MESRVIEGKENGRRKHMRNRWAVNRYAEEQSKNLPLREDEQIGWPQLLAVIVWGGLLWAIAMEAIEW